MIASDRFMKNTSISCLRRGNFGTSTVPILYLLALLLDEESSLESDMSSSDDECLDFPRFVVSFLGFRATTVVPASCDIFNAVTNLIDPNEYIVTFSVKSSPIRMRCPIWKPSMESTSILKSPRSALRDSFVLAVARDSVSYTHLTLPTICSV